MHSTRMLSSTDRSYLSRRSRSTFLYPERISWTEKDVYKRQVFVLMAVNCTAYALARSICLGVDKNVAHNAGGDSMTFHWQINYDTVYQSAQLQFINPSGLPCGELIDIPEIPASPIITGSHTCPVPADQPLGIYTAVLTFLSLIHI